MDYDDLPIGRVLTRREAVALLGASGAALLLGRASLGRAAPPLDCVVRPEQTAGPYFVDSRLHRSDIRSEPSTGDVVAGAPLALAFQIFRVDEGRCTPVPGAHVDVWQCDAGGVYSDVRDPQFDTVGRQFLRGYQVTDGRGAARFQTIYPGWYPGRTVHIHFKVRTGPDAERGYDFTSQLYFDDELTDRVHAREPYASRGPRNVRNERDGIFRRGGRELMLPVTRAGDGYAGTFRLGLAIT